MNLPADLNLSSCQKQALKILQYPNNVFLTGAAGSGKSYLLRHFLQDKDTKTFPVLASTGAAAILVGGRTFHSFFGLGILEGGLQTTIERALKNKRLTKRLKQTKGIVIDEVSMLSGTCLQAAEAIARKTRGNTLPWGGIQIIAVGDFAQLPPVNPFSTQKEWAFLDPIWEMSQFQPAILDQVMRTSDSKFLKVLNFIRDGMVNEEVSRFLSEKTTMPPSSFNGTRMFARRDNVEAYNLEMLSKIKGNLRNFETNYQGKEKEIEKFKRHAPIPDVISLKEKALVMLRQNDPAGRWINGSLGHIKEIADFKLSIQLLTGREIDVEKTDFTLLDADGTPAVTAHNFPVSLAWALTIHKAQGTTLDKMLVDLRHLWEPGQAYVALSRIKNPSGLYIEGWHPRSIFTDPLVKDFHRRLEN